MSQAALLILDEWVIHDLCGDNGKERQRETHQFLQKVLNKCDKLIILESSPFMDKFYKMLMANPYLPVRQFSRFFNI